jgi:valyl-tRNA synthetase
MVNWCPRCESAISDLEVEPEEHQSHLWHIRYPVVNADWDGPRHPWGSGRWAEGATEFIEMATTRPETILGDSGVAVHPLRRTLAGADRARSGAAVLGRRIRIVGDEAVLPEFGTGAVKVTPAHDPTDYEIGQRHHLPQIDVMTPTGLMNEAAGPYAGLDRYACREAIVADFEREGLLVKVTPYTHTVGHCQRCHTVIEPRISTQWFLNVRPLAEQAIAEVRAGHMHIVPERFEKIFFNWLEAIRPWCISPSVVVGPSHPVWYCDACGHEWSALEDPVACPRCGNTAIRQDEDVLDTWFSSGLWPFSTLGWPEETPDMREFYPTDVRETGYDILFFWVARETMLALALTGQVPYHTVYLHGLIRNERGREDQQIHARCLEVRSPLHHPGIRDGRAALCPGHLFDAGQRYEPGSAAVGRGAQLHQQALAGRALYSDEPGRRPCAAAGGHRRRTSELGRPLDSQPRPSPGAARHGVD